KLLAQLHELREDFPAARRVRQEALTILGKLYGVRHWTARELRLELENGDRFSRLGGAERGRLNRATALAQRAAALSQAGRTREALPLAQQSLAVRKELLGDRHLDYAHCLNNLGMIRAGLRQYAEARPLFEQARDLYRGLLGERHPSYALALHNLAGLYRDTE